MFRQLSTFPGSLPPSIIDVKELNFCVRHGNRWIPLAIVTGFSRVFIIPSKLNNITHDFSLIPTLLEPLYTVALYTACLLCYLSASHTSLCLLATAKYTLRFVPLTLASQVVASLLRVYVDVCFANIFGQVLGLLVPVSYIHYCTSTSGLSTM